MVEKIDTLRERKDSRAVSFKRSISHTNIKNTYATKVNKHENRKQNDSKKTKMRSVSPSKVASYK